MVFLCKALQSSEDLNGTKESIFKVIYLQVGSQFLPKEASLEAAMFVPLTGLLASPRICGPKEQGGSCDLVWPSPKTTCHRFGSLMLSCRLPSTSLFHKDKETKITLFFRLYNFCKAFWKYMSKTLKMFISFDWIIPLLRIYPKEVVTNAKKHLYYERKKPVFYKYITFVNKRPRITKWLIKFRCIHWC